MLNYDECRVNVFTQHYENGKPKGGITYTFKVDSDTMFYAKEFVLEKLMEELAKLSSPDCRVEYISHEVLFVEPTDITIPMLLAMNEARRIEQGGN